MKLDRSSLVEIAKLLDKGETLGLAKAANEAAALPEPPRERGTLLEILYAAHEVSSIILALRFLISETNAILTEIETDTKDPVEIFNRLEDALRKRYLEPAKKNKAKIQAMIKAILDYVESILKK